MKFKVIFVLIYLLTSILNVYCGSPYFYTIDYSFSTDKIKSNLNIYSLNNNDLELFDSLLIEDNIYIKYNENLNIIYGFSFDYINNKTNDYMYEFTFNGSNFKYKKISSPYTIIGNIPEKKDFQLEPIIDMSYMVGNNLNKYIIYQSINRTKNFSSRKSHYYIELFTNNEKSWGGYIDEKYEAFHPFYSNKNKIIYNNRADIPGRIKIKSLDNDKYTYVDGNLIGISDDYKYIGTRLYENNKMEVFIFDDTGNELFNLFPVGHYNKAYLKDSLLVLTTDITASEYWINPFDLLLVHNIDNNKTIINLDNSYFINSEIFRENGIHFLGFF